MRSKKVIMNIITSIILQIITIICGLIVPKAIIESFGSSVNGLISSITQFLAYITLLESGFGPVVKSILYKPIANKDKDTIESILKSAERFFRMIAIIFVVYIIALCFFYPLIINSEFDSIYTISLIIIIGISTFAEYFFGITYRLYLQAEQKTYIISTIQIMTIIVNAILVIVLVKLKASIQLIKLISGVVFIFRPILQNIYVKNKYNIKLDNKTDKYYIKQKWDGLAQHIAGVIHSNIDVTVLTIFTDIKEVSVYSIYHLIITGVKNFVLVLSNGIEAAFGDMIAKNEKTNLNKKFSMYEFLYFTFITIIYACTTVLIVPFVKVYTSNIIDTNYARNTFATILVIAYFIHAIKTPYNNLAYTAGKFKETRIGAWIEAILNLVISLLLVKQYGMTGVAIGTLIAVLVREIEFIIYVSKEILDRSVLKTITKAIISTLELLLIVTLCNSFINLESNSYIEWFINGLKTFFVSIVIVLPFNLFYYKEEFKEWINTMKNIKRSVKK